MACISDIKLIRTDTTLDLSQKAEKNTATRSALERRSPTHIYICALVASAPVALAPARAIGTRLRPHGAPDHATHGRSTPAWPAPAGSGPRQPDRRCTCASSSSSSTHLVGTELERDQCISHGTRPLATDSSLRSTWSPTRSTGSPPDPARVCQSAKDTPSAHRRHVKTSYYQSLIDLGISRPTTLASLAIRSECVSSVCGKNLSFSPFCLRSDSK